MVRPASLLVVATSAFAAALAPHARAEIFRCTSGSGAVSYQQLPCGAGESLQVADVPEAFPPVDTAQRDRLFQREAALDQRLEARRERESRETIARLSQPVVVQAPPQEPQYLLLVPPALRARHHRFGAPHPRIAPFMR